MSGRHQITAAFLRGAPHPSELPDWQEFEVAVVGRSNVGKSTFINRLTGEKKLARASSTPGRTLEINCFRISGTAFRPFILVDLPGFGFAKVSKEKRADLSDAIVDYLQSRAQLRGIILLNDCRRAPEGEERGVLELAELRTIPASVVLTKTDKLSNSQLISTRRERAADYGVDPEEILVSGTDKPLNKIFTTVCEWTT